MSWAYPTAGQTFIPSFDNHQHLIRSFCRDPKNFPINRYVMVRRETDAERELRKQREYDEVQPDAIVE